MLKAIKWLALTLTFIGVISVGYYGYSLYDSLKGLSDEKNGPIANTKFGTLTSASEEEIPKWEGKERVNILLLGGDSRGVDKGDIPRSDTMMIASIDPVTKKATLFSILRDTAVKIPGHGTNRINAAFAMGGPTLAMKTASEFTGLEIQYYLYTDFKGFMALVDEIGGIDLDVEKNMDYEDAWDGHDYDIHLKKGYQHLDGKTALMYVRFRHDALSDYTRTERQRKFMMAVAKKIQSTTNLLKLPRIISAVDPYIQTNMSVNSMMKLGRLGYDVKDSGIHGQQLPPTELILSDKTDVRANPEKVREYVQEVLEGTAAEQGTDSASPTGTESNSKTGSHSSKKSVDSQAMGR